MTDKVTESYSNPNIWMRSLTKALNNALEGKLNSIGTVTLTVNSTTTVVTDLRCSSSSVITLMPTTANAASVSPYITPTNKSFKITHASNSQTDRTFNYSVIG